jgi:RNA polymerase sigma factor (sigma-70 family)
MPKNNVHDLAADWSEAGKSADDHLTQLAKLAAVGDKAALNELMERAYTLIEKFCCRICRGDANAQDTAAELRQDFFCRLPDKILGFRAYGKFSTWAYSLLQNRYCDWQRQGQMKSIRFGQMPREFDECDPATQISAVDIRLGLNEALSKLTPRQREVLVLILMGYSQKGIAQMLGLSKSTIFREVGTVRAMLRHCASNIPIVSRQGRGSKPNQI